jgi:hypothetical protein
MGFERRNATAVALRRDVPPLPERDHLLDDRPYLLGLRLGGLDPAMLDQRARQVGIERLPMGRVAPKLPACPLVPHRSSLSRRGGSGLSALRAKNGKAHGASHGRARHEWRGAGEGPA